MPEAPALAPSAPPPPSSTPVMAAPAEIHVTAPATDLGPTPDAPKRGSARERMLGDLRKKVQPSNAPDRRPEPAKAKETSAATEPAADETPPPESETPAESKPGEAPGAEKGKKVSPWKLVEEHKSARAKLEQEIADLRKSLPNPKEKEELTGKLTAAEKRLKDLEEEIRFVNYSKSQEFADKYQKPYDEAWQRAMGELGELVVEDPATGQERPMVPKDLLDLVNAPLQEARAKASKLFGDFTDDVMAHRKEIRRLFDEQNRALENAKKASIERDEQRQRQLQEMRQQTTKQMAEVWTQANEAFVKDEKRGHLFKPTDGDEEGNKRLAKGYEMADRAFAVSPLDPKLKPEQRAEIVKLHAAVRNRAAAFGRLLYLHERTQSELTALKAKLAKYEQTEPPAAGGSRQAMAPDGSTARSQVYGALRKIAH